MRKFTVECGIGAPRSARFAYSYSISVTFPKIDYWCSMQGVLHSDVRLSEERILKELVTDLLAQMAKAGFHVRREDLRLDRFSYSQLD